MMFERFLNSRKKKHYAVFFDENGDQLDTKRIPFDKNNFKYDKKRYFCDSKRYTHLTIRKGTMKYIYWFYDIRYSEPMNFSKDHIAVTPDGQPYIAEQIQTLLDSKILSEVNRKTSGIMDIFDDPKKIIIAIIIIGIGVYMFLNGSA